MLSVHRSIIAILIGSDCSPCYRLWRTCGGEGCDECENGDGRRSTRGLYYIVTSIDVHIQFKDEMMPIQGEHEKFTSGMAIQGHLECAHSRFVQRTASYIECYFARKVPSLASMSINSWQLGLKFSRRLSTPISKRTIRCNTCIFGVWKNG